MVVTGLRLGGVRGGDRGRRWGRSVDGDEVCDRASCEECSFESSGCRGGCRDADAIGR